MISRRLWNSHQRHKFLRGEASRDILKFRVLEMAFPGFSRGIFHRGCYVLSSEYTQDSGRGITFSSKQNSLRVEMVKTLIVASLILIGCTKVT